MVWYRGTDISGELAAPILYVENSGIWSLQNLTLSTRYSGITSQKTAIQCTLLVSSILKKLKNMNKSRLYYNPWTLLFSKKKNAVFHISQIIPHFTTQKSTEHPWYLITLSVSLQVQVWFSSSYTSWKSVLG